MRTELACSTSSLVGTSTTARGPLRLTAVLEVSRISLASNFCRIGSAYAPVFPEPEKRRIPSVHQTCASPVQGYKPFQCEYTAAFTHVTRLGLADESMYHVRCMWNGKHRNNKLCPRCQTQDEERKDSTCASTRQHILSSESKRQGLRLHQCRASPPDCD